MKTDLPNLEYNLFQSASLEALLSDVNADGKITVTEFQSLRDDADKRMEKLVELFGKRNSNLTAYMHSVDVTMQLLQLAVVDAKKAKLSGTGAAIVRDALVSQLEYLKAGAQLALKVL